MAASLNVTVAFGTSAPLGSLTVPRSEVVADWPKAKLHVKRMQKSIAPRWELFTSVPPERLQLQNWKLSFVWELPLIRVGLAFGSAYGIPGIAVFRVPIGTILQEFYSDINRFSRSIYAGH